MAVNMGEVEKLRTYAYPKYGYRLGENGEVIKHLFDGEILPAGWVDSPVRVSETEGVEPSYDAPARAMGGDMDIPDMPEEDGMGAGPLTPPYEDYNFGDLRSEFTRRNGKGPPAGTTKPDLIDALERMDRDG